MKYDFTIIGAGIVGLATAFQLLEREPRLRICVVEKEGGVARHQTGHNSGVIHSGIYYRPGGSKAVNCRKGYRYLLDFCDRYEVPYEICGNLIDDFLFVEQDNRIIHVENAPSAAATASLAIGETVAEKALAQRAR